jgi:cytochrome c
MRMFMKAAVVLTAAAQGCGAAQGQGDAANGEKIYHSCEDCHSLDANEVGPMHRGVFGRKAGAVPGYNYSQALRNSNIVWTEEALDQWLSNPPKFVPGVKMFFRLNKPEDRADVIEFLKERAK